ncbi:MAG: response regulator [Sphingobacteriales bacterium]
MNKLTYIDDCQLDHFILRKILSRYGLPLEIRCTAYGESVLNQLMQQRDEEHNLPDIILLEIAYTPAFDAWDFLDKIKAIYPLMAKPMEVYILSASKYPSDVERLKQYDFVKAFIVKPITKEVLLNLIRQKELLVNNFTMLEAQN